MANEKPLLTQVRVDKYLTATRIFKSRTQAQDACEASHVKVNGKNVRSSQSVKVGDRIETRAPRGDVVMIILELAEKRQSAPRARELYEDHSPPPEEKTRAIGQRDRGMGRPTKADRRKLQRFRGGF
ncbi:MAG: RNA-binding S4 domain-containing protein [Polyangiaceae bacterium]|nr:RNA-binding S4 domain-containing protein [Polyangiaceae bacterium]